MAELDNRGGPGQASSAARWVAMSPSAVRYRAALRGHGRARRRPSALAPARPFVALVGAAARTVAGRLDEGGVELRGTADLDGARAELSRRGESPAGLVVEWSDAIQRDVGALHGVMTELPVLVLSSPQSADRSWAERLGMIVCDRDYAAVIRCFIGSAIQRVTTLHGKLDALAEATALSAYEAALAWRWVLGQRKTRDLMSTLCIGKSTLSQRGAEVLRKTGALHASELVGWIHAEAR